MEPAKIEKGMHWQATLPRGFEIASQAPAHPLQYARKHYRYQWTGKVKDFFTERGRPDKFSRQSIGTADHRAADPVQNPLEGTFKYEYKDGTCFYMETGQMDWVFLAILVKKGKTGVELLYK